MRNLYFFVFLLLIISWACKEMPTETEPLNQSNQKNFLSLPAQNSKLKAEQIFSVSKIVNGNIGDTIDFHFEYLSASNSEVSISGNLIIPAGAFEGNMTFDLLFDQNSAFADFYPSPVNFKVPLSLNLIYTGLNLKGIETDNIDFYYLNDNKTLYEIANKKSIIVDTKNGSISIIGAEIPHFSRWGVGND